MTKDEFEILGRKLQEVEDWLQKMRDIYGIPAGFGLDRAEDFVTGQRSSVTETPTNPVPGNGAGGGGSSLEHQQPITLAQLNGAFARRYEAKRQMAWAYGPHLGHMQEVCDWVNSGSKEGPKARAARLLDNWFATDWAAKVDYKPRFLAENLGAVYNPPVVKREDEPDPEAINERRLREHRQREQAELDRKLSEHANTSTKPPPLEELVGKIGRKI
jgi:hypothetical protein